MSNTSEELYAVADFCLIPMGTNEPSVAEHIAVCQNVLKKSGIKFEVRLTIEFSAIPHFPADAWLRYQFRFVSTFTDEWHVVSDDLEGPWSEVSKAIYDCHAAVHANGVSRIATDIRIGTRTDREIIPGEGNKGKVRRVQEILERKGDNAH